MFTPEELAEMARADAEIEASFCWTNEELKQSREIDREVVVGRMDRDTRRKAAQQKAYREANRDKVAAQRKAYREANRDKVAAQKKAYYEANRDKVAAQQKAYREANRDKVAEYQKAIADARKARKWTQTELAKRLGVSRSLVAQWEVGMVQANWELVFSALPELRPDGKKKAAHGDSSSEDGKGNNTMDILREKGGIVNGTS